MRKVLLALAVLFSVSAWGQTCTPGGGVTCTPNMNLWVLPLHYPAWNVPVNANTNLLDAFSATVVSKNPTGPQEIGNQPLIIDGPVTAASINNVLYSKAGDTIASIEAACSQACTYVVTSPQTISLAADHALSGNVFLRFAANGLWTLTGGHTLTITATVAGTISQHFSTAGSAFKFSTAQPLVPVEWFGAVGDWNGTTGTDNAATIQSCLNALSAGQCELQSRPYRISGTLSITRSSIGIRGQVRDVRSPTIYTNPTGSILITTSTTANLINVFGASISNNVAFNNFNDFTLMRSAAATTAAARGMQFNFTYGVLVDGVVSEDSPGGFYLHASGSQSLGGFFNSVAAWGYGGFTQTSGSFCGWCLDSLDGKPNPSLRIEDSGAFSALGSGVLTYGISSTGTGLEDLHVRKFESANLSYGEYIQAAASPLSALDIHLWEVVNDGCKVSCIYVTTATAPASVEISGGWNFKSGTDPSPVIDLESASDVTLIGLDVCSPTSAGPYVFINGGSNNTVTANHFICSGLAPAVSTSNTQFAIITDNQMRNITTANVISIVGTQHGVISNNDISGTGTNGIFLDSGTHGIAGLPSNAISGTFAAAVSDLGINPTQALYFVIGNGSVYQSRQQVRQTSALCTASANGNCTFTVTFPNAFADSVWKGSCSVETATGGGVVFQVAAAGKTATTATASFHDFSGGSNTLSAVVCEGWE